MWTLYIGAWSLKIGITKKKYQRPWKNSNPWPPLSQEKFKTNLATMPVTAECFRHIHEEPLETQLGDMFKFY